MQFNNKQFEDGIQTSLKSLNDLTKGLDNTDKNSSLQSIQSAVETVSDRFSALGIMGVTALQNIMNTAIETGSRLIKSLTIEPIMGGYQDYERKLTSVQTIMNATGKDIIEVSKYFDQLDEYADLTIYDLGDMTSAFAKFTNAGIDLDKSVPAIKGIANMVALAGQDANAASIAMYNLSQSLAGGFLTTTDYKSLNLANVATKEWKTQMIEGAMAAGTLKKNTKGLYKIPGVKTAYSDQQLFTEALKEGWATTEVLLKVLGDYGDTNTEIGKKAQAAAQDVKSFAMMMDTLKASVGTSWTDSFELIIGDLEESKVLFTGLTKVISGFLDASADARNEVLQTWKDLGGREALIEAFKNAFEGLTSVVEPIQEAFKEIFPPLTGEQLFALTEGIKEFTKNLKIGDETADNLKTTFKGLFAAVDILGQFLSFVHDKFTDLIEILLPGTSGLLSFTAGIGEFIIGLNDAIRAGDLFNKAFDTVKSGIIAVVNAIQDDIKGMMATPAFQTLQDLVTTAAEKIKEGFDNIKESFDNFGGIDLSGAKSFVDNVVDNFRPFTALGTVLSSGFDIIKNVLVKVAPIFAGLASIVGEAFGKLGAAISGAFRDDGFQGVLDLINSGLFAGILIGIKAFMSSLTGITDSAGGFLENITGILDGVKGSLEAYQQTLKAKVLLTIAAAIAVLAGALVVLSLIDPDKLGVALVAITTLFVELAGTMIVLQKAMGAGQMAKIAGQMVLISGAILILSIALKSLAELSWEELATGAVGIGALAAILVVAAQTLSKSAPKMITGGVGMIAFSAAIVILAQAVKQLSTLSVEELAKGLIAVGVIMAEIAGFSQIVKPEKLLSTGIAMNAVGAAMLIFAQAIGKIGSFDVEVLAKGLGAMGIVLLEIAGFTQIVKPERLLSTSIAMNAMGAAMLIFAQAIGQMGSMSLETIGKGLVTMAGSLVLMVGALNLMPKDAGLKAAGLVIMSAALLILAQAMQSMGNMSWEEIAKSLVALAGSLTILTVAMNAMTGGLPGAAAMVVMSAALLMLLPVLTTLGTMPIEEIGLALLALVGIFVVVGGAAAILAPLTPVILALAAGIALLGVGVLAIGAGLLAFSAGLTALAVSGTAGAAALVVIVASIISLIPMIIQKLGEGVIMFAQVIKDGLPIIMDAVQAIAVALIALLVDITPQLTDAILLLLLALLEQLVEYIPEMVDAGMQLLAGILEGISKNISDVVEQGLKIVSEFLDGVAKGIPDVITEAVDVVIAFVRAIGTETPRLIDSGFKMIIDFVNGIADAIRENTPELMAAFRNVAGAIIEGLVNGLIAGFKDVGGAAVNLGKAALDGIKGFLGIHSPSTVFRDEIGKNMALGTAQGITQNSSKAAKAAKKMADDAYNNAKLWIKNYQNDTEYLVSEELAMWEALGERYKGISKEKVEIDKNIASLREKIAKEQAEAEKKDFENSEKWIEHKKKVNELSLSEEIAAWERVQKRFAEGTEMRNKADEELFDARKRQREEEEKAMKEQFDTEKKLIESKRKMEQISLAEEVIAWETLQQQYVEGTEQRMELDQEVFDAKKRLTEEQTRLTDLMTEAEKKYTDELDNRTSAITSAYGIFDELTKKEEVAGDTLTKNLQDQVEAMKDWAADLETLSKKGIDEGLLLELRKMGPSAATEIDALSKMTSRELSTYAGLWQEKSALARSLAVTELAGLRNDTDEKVAEIQGELDKVNKIPAPTMEDSDVDSFKDSAKSQMRAVVGGYEEVSPEVVSKAKEIGTKTNNEFRSWIPKQKETGKALIQGTIDGEKSKQPEVISTVKTIATNAIGELISHMQRFYETGESLVGGFVNGMRDHINDAAIAAAEMARAALDAANSELGIQSPSKEFFKIGRFSVLGFTNALKEYSYLPEEAINDMGGTILDSLKEAMIEVGEVLSSDLDMSPVIRPVIDLDAVDSGIKDINARKFNLSGLNDSVSKVAATIARDRQETTPPSEITKDGKVVSFVQNNYSPKPLSRLEIYRNTKNQFSALKEVLK